MHLTFFFWQGEVRGKEELGSEILFTCCRIKTKKTSGIIKSPFLSKGLIWMLLFVGFMNGDKCVK